jgi:hypothetical protein
MSGATCCGFTDQQRPAASLDGRLRKISTNMLMGQHRNGRFKTKRGPSHAEATAFRRQQAAIHGSTWSPERFLETNTKPHQWMRNDSS